MSSPVSWSINYEQSKTGKATFDEKTCKKGPFSLMCASTYTIPPPDRGPGQATEAKKEPAAEPKPSGSSNGPQEGSVQKSKKARIVVFGSSLAAANRFLMSFRGNRDLIMNSVSWLAEEEDLISIRPKSDRGDMVVLSDRQLILMIGVLLFTPLAWLMAGVVVYSYRKRAVM